MKTKNEWMQSVYQPATQKFPERKYNFKNLSDMDPEPIYTADDLKDWDAERDLGYPGEFPYTRGVQSSVYRGKLWTMRMFAGFGTLVGLALLIYRRRTTGPVFMATTNNDKMMYVLLVLALLAGAASGIGVLAMGLLIGFGAPACRAAASDAAPRYSA